MVDVERSRWRAKPAARAAVLSVLGLSLASLLGAQAGAQDAVSCLQFPGMQVLVTCPSVAASATLDEADGDLVVKVTNESKGDWAGPVAVETPASPQTEASVSESGLLEVVERANTKVNRCVFPPDRKPLAPGASTSCAIPLDRVGDPSEVWITGFHDSVPPAENGFSDDAVPAGVAAIATARSVAIEGDADPGTDDGDIPVTDEGGFPLVGVAAGLAAVVGVGVVAVKRRQGLADQDPGAER